MVLVCCFDLFVLVLVGFAWFDGWWCRCLHVCGFVRWVWSLLRCAFT